MEQLESPTELFKQIETGDKLVLETNYGLRYNRKVEDILNPRIDASPEERKFVFGKYELCEYLVVGHNGPEVKGAEADGSLEANGATVETIVNVTREEWAGEDKALAESVFGLSTD